MGEGEDEDDQPQEEVQNILSLDNQQDFGYNNEYQDDDPDNNYRQMQAEGNYHNMNPRDVIEEEENERTQESFVNKTTEGKDTAKGSSKRIETKANHSEHFEHNDDEDNYEDDYEEEPVPTKPFDNSFSEKIPVNQEDILKAASGPIERPTTRNPRMQRRAEKK